MFFELIPDKRKLLILRWVFILILLAGLGTACQSQTGSLALAGEDEQPAGSLEQTPISEPSATPLPTRPAYSPGELVDYVVQSGDSMPALAQHFNTTFLIY